MDLYLPLQLKKNIMKNESIEFPLKEKTLLAKKIGLARPIKG